MNNGRALKPPSGRIGGVLACIAPAGFRGDFKHLSNSCEHDLRFVGVYFVKFNGVCCLGKSHLPCELEIVRIYLCQGDQAYEREPEPEQFAADERQLCIHVGEPRFERRQPSFIGHGRSLSVELIP